MSTVTRVQQQRRPGRYNIYLDDQFAVAVDEKILIQYNLFKGTEVSEELLAEITDAEYEQKAYVKALNIATSRRIAKKQLIIKLKQAEFPNRIIAKTIDRLEAAGVIDDAGFAEAYTAMEKRMGKLGPRGIAQKLRQYGIDQNLIDDALAEYSEEDQTDLLPKQVAKLFERYHNNARYMAQQKVRQKLIQQGFQSNLIQEAIHEYLAETDTEADTEQEALNLDREATKAANRYRQYEGWEFTRRFKNALYRRGYKLDQIDRWLNEHQE